MKLQSIALVMAMSCAALHLTGLMASTPATQKTHGLSRFDDLKYPENFSHLDYVNPNAPKGGELKMAAIGLFDTLNPYAKTARICHRSPPFGFTTWGFSP